VNQDGTYRALRWLVAYHALLVEERPARARRRGLESHRPIDSWWTTPAAATSSPPSISSAIATWSGSLAAARSPTWPHNPGPVKPARHHGTRGNPSPSSPEAPRPCGTKRGRGAGILRWRSNPIAAPGLYGYQPRSRCSCSSRNRVHDTMQKPAAITRTGSPPVTTAGVRRNPDQGKRFAVPIRESHAGHPPAAHPHTGGCGVPAPSP
jgi:hypothetical protein